MRLIKKEGKRKDNNKSAMTRNNQVLRQIPLVEPVSAYCYFCISFPEIFPAATLWHRYFLIITPETFHCTHTTEEHRFLPNSGTGAS